MILIKMFPVIKFKTCNCPIRDSHHPVGSIIPLSESIKDDYLRLNPEWVECNKALPIQGNKELYDKIGDKYSYDKFVIKQPWYKKLLGHKDIVGHKRNCLISEFRTWSC